MATQIERRSIFGKHLRLGSLFVVFCFCSTSQIISAEFRNPGEFPQEVIVQSGKIGVRFDAAKSWTLSRVEFDGKRLGIDAPGTSYGTVIKFQEKGFVGTGHITEEHAEAVLGLQAELDGLPLQDLAKKELIADQFLFSKKSKIEGFDLENTWFVADDRIEERVHLVATEEMDIDLAYVFMMAWDKSMTDYLAMGLDGNKISGEFEGENKFRVRVPTTWVALYDRDIQTGAVTRILEATESARGFTRLWDKASPYKKHYHQILTRQKVAAGTVFDFRAVTGFFSASQEQWQDRARATAADLVEKP